MDDGLVIVENFAPYIFVGKDAAGRCDAGYRQHAGALKDLKFSFGSAHDFTRTGDRVYFVLPTTWGGIYPEGRFEEHGAWSFVLEKSSGRWRIAAYTWGGTDETDWPAVPRGRSAADAAALPVSVAPLMDVASVAVCAQLEVAAEAATAGAAAAPRGRREDKQFQGWMATTDGRHSY